MLLLLCVLLPILLGAALPLLPGKGPKASALWSLTGVCLTAALLLAAVFSGRDERFALFAGAAPFCFALRLDGAARLYLALTAVLWPPAVLFALEMMRTAPRRDAFFAWYTAAMGAAVLTGCAGNLLTLLLAFLLTVLAGWPLVRHMRDGDSLKASRSYAVCAAAGGLLALVCAAGFSAFGLGDFDPAGSGGQIGRVPLAIFLLAGFLGFGMLAGILPFSGWMAKATLAPAPVSALLHTMSANAGIIAVMRLLYGVASPAALAGGWLQNALLIAAIATAAYGEIRMLRTPDVEMRIAWSSVGNFSFMLIALSLFSGEGLTAALSHMLSHSLAKAALFFCTGIILMKTRRVTVREMHGIGRHLPWTFAVFTVAGLSLMGMPPLPGFVSKSALITASFSQGGWWQHTGAVVMAVSTVLTAMDIFIVVFPAFCMHPTLEDGEELRDCGAAAKTALAVLCALMAAASLLAGPLTRDLQAIGRGMGLL